MKIEEIIKKEVNKTFYKLSPHLQSWCKSHLVQPSLVEIFADFECRDKCKMWLVTDHIGKNDSSYRVLYDDERNMFGLDVFRHEGGFIFMGHYGDFATAVLSM